MAQTLNAFTLQNRQPGAYTFGPGKMPTNVSRAQLTLTGNTVLPPGAEVTEVVYLSFDNRVTFDPASSAYLRGGTSPTGYQQTVPLEGATDYRVDLTVTGAAVTIGATLSLT